MWIWVSTGLAGAIGWLLKMIINLRNEFTNHKVEVARTYVCKDDMNGMVKDVKSHVDKRVDRIEDKLDQLMNERREGR